MKDEKTVMTYPRAGAQMAFARGATAFGAFSVGALAMGSVTYEWVLRHLREAEEPQPWPYEQPAWVFTSRSLPGIEGADIRFVQGDVRPVHQEMSAVAGDKNIWLVGGGELVGQFHDHGLLDELIIQIAPVTLGAGSPLLPRKITKPPLRLISATTYGETFAELRYEVRHPGQITPAESANPSSMF